MAHSRPAVLLLFLLLLTTAHPLAGQKPGTVRRRRYPAEEAARAAQRQAKREAARKTADAEQKAMRSRQPSADVKPTLAWPPQDTLTPLVMHEDPYLPVPVPLKRTHPAILPLFVEALASDENDLKRDAAVSIILVHSQRCLDCSSMADALTAVLQSENENRLVRKDVARALITIDARESADTLLAAIGRDPDLVRIIEPALARWGHKPAQDVWLSRLKNAADTPRYLLVSAIRGLGQTRNSSAVDILREIILKSPRETFRLEAARSLGLIQHTGLEPLAAQLLEEHSAVLSPGSAGRRLLHRQMAALVLRHHSSEEARRMLLPLAADSNGALASIAWESLLTSAPAELRTLTEDSATAADAKVRESVVRTLLATPDVAAVEQLGRLLDDRHPRVRNAAREALLTISGTPELREAVLTAGTTALHRDSWQGLEQAAVLLGTLDHEPVADRCFELLTHPRSESAIAAGWALRKLAIPETLPRMLKFCEDLDAALVAEQDIATSAPFVAAHLFDAMGQMNYGPAERLLRLYIPKRAPRLLAPMRPSAINALGLIKAGSADRKLSELFYERLIDESPFPIYELEEVRYASTIALARIGVPSFESKLRAQYKGQSYGPLPYVLEWALTQFTGEPLGDAVPLVKGLPLLPLKPIGFRLEAQKDGEDAGATATP